MECLIRPGGKSGDIFTLEDAYRKVLTREISL